MPPSSTVIVLPNAVSSPGSLVGEGMLPFGIGGVSLRRAESFPATRTFGVREPRGRRFLGRVEADCGPVGARRCSGRFARASVQVWIGNDPVPAGLDNLDQLIYKESRLSRAAEGRLSL
jgi:hypothetical protein